MTTEERLEHLERELVRVKRCDRWLMLVAACLGMVFAWVFLARSGRLGTSRSEGPTAATQPGGSGSSPAAESLAGPGPATAPAQKEIRARRFVLEDDQGKTRALLAMDKWGPSLLLVDANENPRVALDASRNGPGLMLYDRLGKGGVALGQDDDDGPAMRLLDENGKVRAALAMPGGTPGLVLVDETCWPWAGALRR